MLTSKRGSCCSLCSTCLAGLSFLFRFFSCFFLSPLPISCLHWQKISSSEICMILLTSCNHRSRLRWIKDTVLWSNTIVIYLLSETQTSCCFTNYHPRLSGSRKPMNGRQCNSQWEHEWWRENWILRQVKDSSCPRISWTLSDLFNIICYLTLPNILCCTPPCILPSASCAQFLLVFLC